MLLGNTPLHLAGVAGVKVEWWNGWYGLWEDYTNADGCWQILNEDYGVGYMNIYFKNEKGRIRAIRQENGGGFEMVSSVCDQVGEIAGPYFNNISVIYTPDSDSTSDARLFWYAAHALNALHEYHSLAQMENMEVPPYDLNILLAAVDGAASAPMLKKAGIDWSLHFEIEPLTVALLRENNASVLSNHFFLVVLANTLTLYAPDIVYAYGGGEPSVSDAVNETFYHEYGHAAHYHHITNATYWKDNISYIVNNVKHDINPPYGLRNIPEYERCAIIESWGYHIGPQYADQIYGIYHSRTSSENPLIKELRRWKYSEESFKPDIAGGSQDNFIPKGLALDLIDFNSSNPPGLIDGVTDPIGGYTNKQYFEAISLGAPSSFAPIRATLSGSPPVGIYPTQVIDLFAQYGY